MALEDKIVEETLKMLKDRSEAYYIDVSYFNYVALVIGNKLYVKNGNTFTYSRRLAYSEKIPKDKRVYLSRVDLSRMLLSGEIE
jgi:hypothetical protein